MNHTLTDKFLRQHGIQAVSHDPGLAEELEKELRDTQEYQAFLRREWLARHPVIAILLDLLGGK